MVPAPSSGVVWPLGPAARALLAVGLLGCAGYTTVEADPDSSVEAPAIAPRCYDDAHTIVVGPRAGCASLTLRVEDDFGRLTCHGVRYTPLRVVRRDS